MLSQNRQFLTPSPTPSCLFLLIRVCIVNRLWGYPLQPPTPLPIRHSLWASPLLKKKCLYFPEFLGFQIRLILNLYGVPISCCGNLFSTTQISYSNWSSTYLWLGSESKNSETWATDACKELLENFHTMSKSDQEDYLKLSNQCKEICLPR